MTFLVSVVCDTDIPDDAPQASENDSEVSVGGEAVAKVIAEWLGRHGMTTSVPALHEGHCWEIAARRENRSFLIAVIQNEREVIVQTSEISFLGRKLFGGRSIHRDLVQLLHKRLVEDGRFHSLAWYPFGFDARHQGAAGPLKAK